MNKYLAFLFAFLLCTGSFVTGISQQLESGPQVLSFHSEADDTEQPYAIYIPEFFDDSKAYPVVIMLHGAGSNHRLALRRVFGKSNAEGETDVEASRYFPSWDHVPYIVAAPFARGTAGYQGIPEQDVYAVLEDVKKRFKVDENRIYLTGLSMGGGGTLWLGLSRPDIWAAIAPVCPAPPQGSSDLVGNALNLPVHFFHGDADPVVPIAGTRAMVEQMQEKGIFVQSEEYEGVQHDSWVNAYANGRLFEWLGQFERDPFPSKVSFSTRQLAYNKAYWVEILQIEPGALASIDAEIISGKELKITSQNIRSFQLSLANHPEVDAGDLLQIDIDGRKLRVAAQDIISFYKDGPTWRPGNLIEQGGLVKQKGLSGPIYEAFSYRHIYVFGTADSPTQEVLEQRRSLALEAANWSAYRGEFLGRIHFFPRVLADKEIRPSDLDSSHLILFGTTETNSVIKTLENDLPMHLSLEDESLGMMYIYPREGKLVVINSGKPWWGGNRPPGYSFTGPAQQNLPRFKDFMIYRDNPDTILSEGYFDTYWKITREQEAELKTIPSVHLKQ
ncbi:carboxylesterase family protein [Lunatibacter salilacus]|uniref:carboxylesterase family protein n=1 Tax=Lunatibacter salilacus TaxID=2483804 RepID=UPI00131B2689|nr:alpha/beta hydrolase-fold protein [Lunatibacter salilacus]